MSASRTILGGPLPDDGRVDVDEWRRVTAPLHLSLPFVFPNGAQFTSFDLLCSRCQQVILFDEYRGEITPRGEHVAEVRAWGFCAPCNLLTPSDYDVWDDLSMVGRHPETNRVERWTAKRDRWALH